MSDTNNSNVPSTSTASAKSDEVIKLEKQIQEGARELTRMITSRDNWKADAERWKVHYEEVRKERVEKFIMWGVILLVIVALLAGIHWLARGTAFGASARRNAEHEAQLYVQRTYPHLTASVYCAPVSGTSECSGDFNARCRAVFDDHPQTFFCCDDDSPVTNNGCRPSTDGR